MAKLFHGVNLTFPIPSPDEKKNLNFFKLIFILKALDFILNALDQKG